MSDPAEPPTFNVDDLVKRVPRKLGRFPRLLRGALSLTWRAARREFLIMAALQVVAGLALTGMLFASQRVLQRVLDLGEGTGTTAGDVVPALVLLVLLMAVGAAIRITQVDQQRLLAELTGNAAMRKVLDVATTVDLVAFDQPGFHDRLQRAQINAQMRPPQMAAGVLGLMSATIAIVAIAGTLVALEPVILPLVVVAYVPAWYAARRASRALHEFTNAQTERERRRSYVASVLMGKDEAKEVRAFGLRKFFGAAYDRLCDARIADLRRCVRKRLGWGLAGSVLAASLLGATLGVLVWFVSTGRTPLAAAGAAAGAVVLLGQRLNALSFSAGSLYESSLFIEDFTTFVEPTAAVAGQSTTTAPTPEAPPGFRRLEVLDASFTYPSATRPALRGVSLHVDQGEVVALVGENGSGKTTLAKLIAGLYTPAGGTITWDGADAGTFDPDELRRAVAVIFQDFVRYHLTARTNIEVGQPEREGDTEALVEAARRAGIHDELTGLRRGYDTQLGPHFLGGTDLSVGQWQRVALARAFFRDAAFLILDEPTAALDPIAESHLFESIRALSQGRSVLLISHRFSSVRSADRIYVLHRGEIAEEGTHLELMAAGGRYAELFTLQASAYLDVEV